MKKSIKRRFILITALVYIVLLVSLLIVNNKTSYKIKTVNYSLDSVTKEIVFDDLEVVLTGRKSNSINGYKYKASIIFNGVEVKTDMFKDELIYSTKEFSITKLNSKYIILSNLGDNNEYVLVLDKKGNVVFEAKQVKTELNKKLLVTKCEEDKCTTKKIG